MKPQYQYWIVFAITLLILIFSVINFAYFIQIRNDSNPEVSKEAPISIIVMNGIIIVIGLGVCIYCMVKALKADKKDVEAKIFKHFRDDVSQNKAVLQNRFGGVGEPALVCDKLNSAVRPDGTIENQALFDNVVNGFQNLGLNIYEFINECEAEGLIKPNVDGGVSGIVKALDGYNSGIIEKHNKVPTLLTEYEKANKDLAGAVDLLDTAEKNLAEAIEQVTAGTDRTDIPELREKVAEASAGVKAALATANTANTAALAAAFKAAQGR